MQLNKLCQTNPINHVTTNRHTPQTISWCRSRSVGCPETIFILPRPSPDCSLTALPRATNSTLIYAPRSKNNHSIPEDPSSAYETTTTVRVQLYSSTKQIQNHNSIGFLGLIYIQNHLLLSPVAQNFELCNVCEIRQKENLIPFWGGARKIRFYKATPHFREFPPTSVVFHAKPANIFLLIWVRPKKCQPCAKYPN